MSGNYAYVVQDSWGFGVIEVSNPADPQRVGGYDTSRGACGVAVSGNYVYVADWDAGLVILEMSGPPAITRAERTANNLTIEWNDWTKGM